MGIQNSKGYAKMRHNVFLEGWNCRLRPVRLSDAEYIVDLRNQDFTKGFIHATSASVEMQRKWIEEYFMRDDDYYWIVENKARGRMVGTYGLYNIVGRMGMPGRMILQPDAELLPAVLPILLREFAFEKLNLERLVGCVVPSNQKVKKFAEMMGSSRMSGCPVEYAHIDAEIRQDWYELNAATWPDVKKRWFRILGPRDSGR